MSGVCSDRTGGRKALVWANSTATEASPDIDPRVVSLTALTEELSAAAIIPTTLA